MEESFLHYLKKNNIAIPTGFPDFKISGVTLQEIPDAPSPPYAQITAQTFFPELPFAAAIRTMCTFNGQESIQVVIKIKAVPKPSVEIEFVAGNFSIPTGGEAIDVSTPGIHITVLPLKAGWTGSIGLFCDLKIDLYQGQKLALPNTSIDFTIADDVITAAQLNVYEKFKKHPLELKLPSVLSRFDLQLNSLGFSAGILFDPPSFLLGFQASGDLIKEGIKIENFAIVCDVEGEPINPQYLAFKTNKLNLSDLSTLFNIVDLPISLLPTLTLKKPSFAWCDKPVTLPDGTPAAPGLSFSTLATFLDVSFYVNLNYTKEDKLIGALQMDGPLSIGSIFSVSGDGTEIKIKEGVNHIIPNTEAKRKAVKKVTETVLCNAGGATFSMNVVLGGTPSVSGDINISFLDVLNATATATVSENQISASFSLDNDLFPEKASFNINTSNTSAGGLFSFTLPSTASIPLVNSLGVNFGVLSHTNVINASVQISDTSFTANLNTSFDGNPPIDLGTNINLGSCTTIEDMITAFVSSIESNIANIISYFMSNPKVWVNAYVNKVILGPETGVVNFGITALHALGIPTLGVGKDIKKLENVADTAADYTADKVTKVLSTVYGFGAKEVGPVLHDLGKAPADIASALHSVFTSTTAKDVAKILNDMGIPTAQIASALNTAFDSTAHELAKVFSEIGVGAKDTAKAIKSVFTKIAPKVLEGAMKAAGYVTKDIASAFKDLGGDFASAAKDIGKGIEKIGKKIIHALNPSHWL